MELWLQAVAGILAAYGAVALAASAVTSMWRSARRRPLLSVLLVVRDQEQAIEGFVEELLARHRGGRAAVDLELVAVDDRSVDQTGEILARVARRHAGLLVASMRPAASGTGAIGAGEAEVGEGEAGEGAASPLEVGRALCRSNACLVLDLRGGPEAIGQVRAVAAALMGGLPRPAAGERAPAADAG